MKTYCRAYHLGKLRGFSGWSQAAAATGQALDDSETVYLWDDFTVVRNPVSPDPEVLWDETGPQWRDYCATELDFSVPDELGGLAEAGLDDSLEDK